MFDFPNSPTLGQTYTPAGGPTYVWNNTAWLVLSPGSSYSTTIFTATAGQTTFSTTYVVGAIYVYRNGVLLAPADFTATDGTSIVLANACNAGDTIEVINLAQVPYVNCVQKTGDTMTGALVVQSTITSRISTGGVLNLDSTAAGTSNTIGSYANSGVAFANLYYSASQHFFLGGGTERMRIDTIGNVGIGQTSPTKKLCVANSGAAEISLDPFGRSGETATSILSYNRSTSAYIPIHIDGSELQFYTSGTEKMRVAASGNVGIGFGAPAYRLDVRDSVANGTSWIGSVNTSGTNAYAGFISYVPNAANAPYSFWETGPTGDLSITNTGSAGTGNIIFKNTGAERARFNSAGNFLLGTSGVVYPNNGVVQSRAVSGQQCYIASFTGSSGASVGYWSEFSNTTGTAYHAYFTYNNTNVGSIISNSTTTTYGTTSDYRLKDNVQPMQNALAKVALLNPVTYTWKADGSDGQGFIAHELQAVCPDAVTGEKDAVDDEGNPVYQGVDASFLVATLTKAIQELSAKLDEANARIAKLEGAK